MPRLIAGSVIIHDIGRRLPSHALTPQLRSFDLSEMKPVDLTDDPCFSIRAAIKESTREQIRRMREILQLPAIEGEPQVGGFFGTMCEREFDNVSEMNTHNHLVHNAATEQNSGVGEEAMDLLSPS